MKTCLYALVPLLCGCLINFSHAETEVSLHGTLIEAPPCVINDNNIIYVDFGNEVMTTRVDGSNYIEKLDFTVDCSEGMSTGKTLVVGIVGNGASFDSNVLETNIPDLGIKFYLEKIIPYDINKFNLHLNNNNPTSAGDFYAVPVKRSGSTLPSGDFSATASLVIKYN